jgi:hypothetical protein
MALRGQIVDFVRLHCLDDADQVGGIRHIAVMELKVVIGDMGILINMINTRRVERRRPALDAVHKVSFGKQEIRQICTILPGNARD